jgi:hypothetical protein
MIDKMPMSSTYGGNSTNPNERGLPHYTMQEEQGPGARRSSCSAIHCRRRLWRISLVWRCLLQLARSPVHSHPGGNSREQPGELALSLSQESDGILSCAFCGCKAPKGPASD